MKTFKKIGAIYVLCFLLSCENQTSKNFQNYETNNIDKKEQDFKTDWEELELRGKVKVLKQEEFYGGNEDSEIGLKTGSNSYSYKFDVAGSKIEEQYYDSIGLIKSKTEYIYNSLGQKSKKKISDLENKLLHLYQYEYNEKGQISRINVTDYEGNDKYKYYCTSKYDEKGNEILSVIYTLEGTKVQSTEYKYENNKRIKLTLYDNLDSPYAICEYKYNEKGDVEKEIFFTGNNLLFEEYTIKYVYDSQNNWIQKIYSLDIKHMSSSSNAKRKLGVQTITMRTITYH